MTLGEIKRGKGRIRILGSLLPMPTEEFDHPYGLESYGVMYSGYEVFRNLLDWDRKTGSGDDDDDDGIGPTDDDRGAGPTDADRRPDLPATGGGIGLGLLALCLGVVAVRVQRRR